MQTDLIQAFLAVLAFLGFPFLVIAAAAGILVLWDRLTHLHLRH